MAATLEEILRVGREMRSWQKRYFKAKRGTDEKQSALLKSIRAEKEFDDLLCPQEKQLDLFSVIGTEEPELVLTPHGIEQRPVVASMEGEEDGNQK